MVLETTTGKSTGFPTDNYVQWNEGYSACLIRQEDGEKALERGS